MRFLKSRSEKWEKGQAELARLRNPDMVATLMATRDILTHYSGFLDKMLKDGLLLHSVRNEVDAVCAVLGGLVEANDG